MAHDLDTGVQDLDIDWVYTCIFYYFIFILFYFMFFFRATPAAYGSSQTRGPIGAAAAALRQSHSNTRSKPRLRPMPQLTAMLDP